MHNFNKMTNLRSGIRLFSSGIIALQSALSAALAADNSQEILNRLYQEIISSSPAVRTVKGDSMVNPGKSSSHGQGMVLPSEKIPDLASERLREEIDKIIQDAKIRHSDAIKFLQDSK